MEWRQPKAFHRFYQLVMNGQEQGTLQFQGPGSLAKGDYGGKQWTFQRTGFWKPRILVREVGSELDVAEFAPNWNGSGAVKFASGVTYGFKHTNFWRSEWVFEAADGTAAVTVHGPSGALHQHGEVLVSEAYAQSPDVPVLVVLIWYVRVLMNEDAASAATVVAVTS
jgi:hypothetical protein